MSNEHKLNALNTVRSFLIENEQYGDDWSFEIEQLQHIINDYNKHSLVNWEAGYDSGYQEGKLDAIKESDGRGWRKCTTCGMYAGYGKCAKPGHATPVCPDWIGTD